MLFPPGGLPASARLTLGRTGVLKWITLEADGWYRDREVYTLVEPSFRPGSPRAVVAPALAASPLRNDYDLDSTGYYCYAMDNYYQVVDPERISDHTALYLVRGYRGNLDRNHDAWIYGPVWRCRVVDPSAYSADFCRRTPDLDKYLALVRYIVVHNGGYCEVY